MRYLDYRQIQKIRTLTPGPQKCLVGEVVGLGTRPLGGSRRKICEMVVSDGTGIALVVWFHFNEKYLKKLYPTGKKILVAGDCQRFGAKIQFAHPEIEEWDDDSGSGLSFVPVYPLTEGLYQKTIRKIIRQALDQFLPALEESPYSVRASGDAKLSMRESIAAIHAPPPDCEAAALNDQSSRWHQRVIYDEMFYLQLGMALKKIDYKKEEGVAIASAGLWRQKVRAALPFKLTAAQSRVIDEIAADLALSQPMNRLVQGDVGSGKTLVAFLSGLDVCEAGFQVALMAPTEILAQQHQINLSKLAGPLGLRVELLTRTTPKPQKEKILQDLKTDDLSFVIGTHALIQEEVGFSKLGLVIVDEQHRFGVMQRAALKSKATVAPHVLVMTATPIPRTLAMSVYGDLDVSVVDEMPAGRKPIATKVFRDSQRKRMLDLLASEIAAGRQAYVVYPLIEESEKSDLKNAVEGVSQLQEHFPKFTVGLLHGKMKSDEKDTVMARFKSGEIRILVSTTVIEVGVDVPNATVMVVEHAERFGLSQLHQLRGRVGRGAHQSYCYLMAGYAQCDETRYRLGVMEETTDGFKVAEEDLKIRGPGDFIGTRQSGLPEFRLAQLVRDGHLLAVARKRAQEIVEIDPTLSQPEHVLLKKILKLRWEGKLALAEVS